MVRPTERIIFHCFLCACPDIAKAIVSSADGDDPPDFVCTDTSGRRIGLELGEWLNQTQMARNRAVEAEEESFTSVIAAENEPPRVNFGHVFLHKKEGARLQNEDAKDFREELFKLIDCVDAQWTSNPDWSEPQGLRMRDLARYPFLDKYLLELEFCHSARLPAYSGISWINFPPKGGAYTPADAVSALLSLIDKKTQKYQGLHEREQLAELWMLAYYDQGLIYNTPYFAPGFDFQDVCDIARDRLRQTQGVFQRVYLFEATRNYVEKLWPRD